MHATRASFVLVTALIVAAACGDDEGTSQTGKDASGGAAGSLGGSAGVDGSGGSAGQPDASAGSAGAAGSAGTTSTGGASGNAGSAGTGGGSGATPPSCEGLAKDCGPGASNDCCDSIAVPSGTFTLGRVPATADDCACSICGAGCSSCGSLACGTDEAGVTASVSAFRLDRYEVTVGRFRKFVEHVAATGWSPPPGSGKHGHLPAGGIAGESGWDAAWPALPATKSAWDSTMACSITGQTYTWTPAPGANERRPINCLTWYRAYAFCIWDGGFLPTEAEWEYAASGGEDRVYPWSVPPASTTADPSHASYDCLGDGTAGCSLADITDVGSKSAGNARWGHADLAGNLWELVLDGYAPSYVACDDCANLSLATSRVIRGGVYNDEVWSSRAANRHNHDPAIRGANVGVRCARAP